MNMKMILHKQVQINKIQNTEKGHHSTFNILNES